MAGLAKFARQNAPRGRAAQALIGFIELGQQLDVGAGVALWEAMATAAWIRSCPVAT